jgi:hypothetical protein
MSSKQSLVVSARQPTIGSSPKRHLPTKEDIAGRAYELFLLRGAGHGADVDDWLQAERELKRN